MTNTKYAFDPWAVRKLETDDMGHEHWDEADTVDYQEDSESEDENEDDEEEEDGDIEQEDEDEDDE